MSNEVVLHFGELEKREWPDFPIGNILLTGVCGSGKSVVLNNLLSELILMYNSNGIAISVWDGKGAELVRGKGKYGIEFCDVAAMCCNYAESNIEHFVCNRLEKALERKKFITDAGYGNLEHWNSVTENEHLPVEIIVFEELQASIDKLDNAKADEILRGIKAIMDMSRMTGQYVIISSQSLNGIETLLEDSGKLFDIVACTRGTSELSQQLFGSNVATKGPMRDYGDICLRDRNKDVWLLNVPFYYNMKTMRRIINQRILPQGMLFNEDRLIQWAIFIQGCYGEISGIPDEFHVAETPKQMTAEQIKQLREEMRTPEGQREFTAQQLKMLRDCMPNMQNSMAKIGVGNRATTLGITKEEGQDDKQ